MNLRALPSVDPIDAAIEAVEAEPETMTVKMVVRDLTLMSGRPFRMAIPIDFTDTEAVQAVQMLLIGMQQIRDAVEQQSASGLVVASSIPRGIVPPGG